MRQKILYREDTYFRHLTGIAIETDTKPGYNISHACPARKPMG